MFDIQLVHMREIIKLRDVSVVSVLQYPRPVGQVTGVLVDQLHAPFLLLPSSLLVALPQLVNRTVDGVAVAGWVVSYSITSPSGVVEHKSFDAQVVPVQTLVLRLLVGTTAAVEEVWVNSRKALFTIASATSILCSLPSGVDKLEQIMIVAATNTVSKSQMFSYLARSGQISGAQKMTAQFLKLFHTTPGTDLFRPSSGGGAQKIVGSNVTDTSLAATLVRAVSRTEAQMIVGQSKSKVPGAEKLLRAEILRVVSNPNDPTTAGVELKLVSQSSQQSVLNFLLGL